MKLIKKSIIGLLLSLSFIVPCSACAENMKQCSIDSMFKLLSSNLGSYKKIQAKSLEQSAEGASIEYYYSGSKLKAIKSIYYGETSKTEIEYYFKSPRSYAVKLTEYFYSAPIYIENSEIATTNESQYIVCDGELVRGIGDDVVVTHHERSRKALKKILEATPK